ncbi:MAG: DUF559 domain-containing protein [Candidatus Kapabacteria bacterium]|nr:DUF559 domain-containing protein [Candidatus Kapabacteria bacterium]
MLEYNNKLKSRASDLRNNLTDAESILWQRLRYKQLKNSQFNRQKPIGNYIVDFYYDNYRDEYLKSLGLKILRFSNYQIMKQLQEVVEFIYREMMD